MAMVRLNFIKSFSFSIILILSHLTLIYTLILWYSFTLSWKKKYKHLTCSPLYDTIFSLYK